MIHQIAKRLIMLVMVGQIPCIAFAQEWPQVSSVDRQPLMAAVERVATALDAVGRPLSVEQLTAIGEISRNPDEAALIRSVQELLDPLCLAAVRINPESRVKVVEGPAAKTVVQDGWTTFLVKVHNEAGINPVLQCSSPQARPLYLQSDNTAEPEQKITLSDVHDRWLDIAMPAREPMKAGLSGLSLEYRIIQIYSRDAGPREATLAFDIGQGTQDLGFRNELAILFECRAGYEVTINVTDASEPLSNEPLMVALEIRDRLGRVYPNPARRLAPDFFFHDQIYRQRGETVSLPQGEYDVRISRGPEYSPVHRTLNVTGNMTLGGEIKRWIDPVQWNWYSGDHHVHAAGCSHYQNPTAGVGPADMMRHVLGEDLKVGCVLSWGPCWYNQKQYFDGNTSALSTPRYLMRYDVEVSGFPSSHAGHLCLLRLSEDDYPGTTRIEEWPSWTLPVLQWGQRQGGVVGYSHSGWGLELPDYLADGRRVPPHYGRDEKSDGRRAADQLPDYAMPPFNGIGANEFIVTVAHDACDFISAVDTPAIWELNIWYHTLNCGFRSRISGETDFPCIYGDRVGLGRVYVQLDPDQPLDFDGWVNGLKDGRSYCGDGMSHVLKFEATSLTADDSRGTTVRLGWPGSQEEISQLNLEQPGKVRIETAVAAWLAPTPSEQGRSIRARRLDEKPYWHIERCRIEDTRRVMAELIVNGQAVQSQVIVADGAVRELQWTVDLERSSWVAVRILPSVHSNPIFVEVAGQPIRASRQSAEWCRRAVDVCRDSKSGQIRESDMADAQRAYDQAAAVYDEIIRQSFDD